MHRLDPRHGARALALVTALWVAACGGESTAEAQPSRCAVCGMRVEPTSGWRAGGQRAEGSSGAGELAFDSPKCMFRQHLQRGGVRDPWVIEYYSQERRPASGLFFVLGSDLRGPMGRDLVPVAGRENAERLMQEHHGERVLAFSEVTSAIVDGLFRPQR